MLGIGAALVVGSGLTSVWAARGPITDQMITDAVEDEIHHDPAISSAYVDIRTDDGIVTLSGLVHNLLAKTQATRIAETVKGVRAVVNQLHVKASPTLSDDAIRKDIETALNLNPATDPLEVDVQVQTGVATLSGTIQSWQEKQAVGRVAKGVKGVVGVEDRLQVRYPESRPDREIQADVEHKLRWDVRVDHALIEVEVQNGQVQLTGTVGSAAEKRAATVDAGVAGVKEIDVSGLQVEKWARDPALRENKYVIKSDEEIRQAVERALQTNPWVNASQITSEVRDSRVTLRGAVPNLNAKRAAAQTARNTVGVAQVTNRIKVRTPQAIRDEALAADIRGALTREPYVSRYGITVEVDNGVAFLRGLVPSYFEKAQAEEAAASVRGIVAAQNHLRLLDRSTPLVYDPFVYEDWSVYDYPWYDYAPEVTWKRDAEIKQDIEAEIWWSPFIDTGEVAVAVADGVATLTGAVDSRSEWYAASENAYEGGAIRVVNQIEVEQSQ
jgi:osmotically-inducible protein OsmY